MGREWPFNWANVSEFIGNPLKNLLEGANGDWYPFENNCLWCQRKQSCGKPLRGFWLTEGTDYSLKKLAWVLHNLTDICRRVSLKCTKSKCKGQPLGDVFISLIENHTIFRHSPFLNEEHHRQSSFFRLIIIIFGIFKIVERKKCQ